jgi:beta-lactamase class D
MKRTFNAVIKQDAGWWIGWVEEALEFIVGNR